MNQDLRFADKRAIIISEEDKSIGMPDINDKRKGKQIFHNDK